MRKGSLFKALAATAFGFAVAIAGVSCKQDEGEFCQIDSDCKDGLECNVSINECQRPGQTPPTPDAAPLVDSAPTPDAEVGTPDAEVSTPDAAPAADAELPDAAP